MAALAENLAVGSIAVTILTHECEAEHKLKGRQKENCRAIDEFRTNQMPEPHQEIDACPFNSSALTALSGRW